MNYKVIWSELKEADNEVIIHLERLDTGKAVDVVVDKDKPETWDAAMSEATDPE